MNNRELEEYLLQHTDIEPDYLVEINRKTHQRLINPRMLSGHLQGRALALFSKMIAPERILEIGTFTGYSALCLAEGLSPEGVLHTIECDDELEDFIRENFLKSPYFSKIELHIGDALQLIPAIPGDFDLVFIDADKRDYQHYLELVLLKVKTGGFILVDNTLWDGKVLNATESNDVQTRSIINFNNKLTTDERVEKVILPLRDGLTIIRKK